MPMCNESTTIINRRIEKQLRTNFYIVMFITIMVDIVGILGNVLLVKVMTKSKTIHRSYGVYLIALGVTDSMNMMFNILRSIDSFVRRSGQIHGFLHISAWGCKIYSYVESIFMILSSWLIVCLSIERFLVMYFPLRGRVWWKSHYITVFIIVIVVGIITQSPRLYYITFDESDSQCHFEYEANDDYVISILFDSLNRFLFVYALPGSSVFILNILIILRMYGFIKSDTVRRLQEYKQRYSLSSGTSITPSIPPTVGEKTRADRKRATCILLTISTTYLICMAPESIATMAWSVIGKDIYRLANNCYLMKSFYRYFHLYNEMYKTFTLINYGSTFYTYLIFGKRFRREISSLWKLSSTSSTVVPPGYQYVVRHVCQHEMPVIVDGNNFHGDIRFDKFYRQICRPHTTIPRCNSDQALQSSKL